MDVNGDGRVSPSDALQVINWLGRYGLESPAESVESRKRDVDGSGFVAPRDALIVINQLGRDAVSSSLRLANDTAPGGATNFDRLTNDVTLRGHIVAPSQFASATFSLRGVDNLGSESSLDLAGYLDGKYFEVPSNQVLSLLRSSTGNASDLFTVELVAHHDNAFSENALVLAKLNFVYDMRGPELILPASLTVDDDDLQFVILEPSGVTTDSLSTLIIRQPIEGHADGGPIRAFQTRTSGELVLVDLALAQFELNEDESLSVQIDGVLEDRAGNRTTLQLRRSLPRSGEDDGPSEPPVQVADLRPDVGQVFDDLSPTVRAGQLITVQIPPSQAHAPYSFDVVEKVDGRTVTVQREQRQPVQYDIQTGGLKLWVPNDAVSGDVRNGLGEILFHVNVIPSHDSLPVTEAGVWEFDPYSQSLGGMNVDDGEFQFRVFNSDDFSDPAFNQQLTRADVAEWNVLRDGANGIHGFATAQLAGPYGVSGPIEVLEARPEFESGIDHLVLTNDGNSFWLASRDEISRVDYLSGEAIVEVDLENLLPTGSNGVVAGLHIVPIGAFYDRVQYVAPSPDPATEVLVVRIAGNSAQSWLLLDLGSGELIGSVSDVIDSLDADFLAETVYHPVHNTWFQFWRDGTYWREISLKDGQLVAQGDPADSIPEQFIKPDADTSNPGSPQMKGGIFWDQEAETVRLFVRPKSATDLRAALTNSCSVEKTNSYGTPPTMFDFDPSGGEFVRSETTLKHYGVFSPSLSRMSLQGDWLFQQSTPFGSRYNTTEVIQRECAARVPQPAAIPDAPVLHGIIAVADVDEIFDPSIPSAIPGDRIELIGEKFTPDTTVLFQVGSRKLINSTFDFPAVGVEDVQVSEVSDDGTRAVVTVPAVATSGEVRIAGQMRGVELQIAPKIEVLGDLVGDVALAERMLDSYDVLGIDSDVDEPFSLLIDNQVFLGCDLPLDAACQPKTDSLMTPVIHHSIEIVTRIGRDRIEIPTADQSERSWQVSGIAAFEENFAAEYDYSGLGDNTVLAGSNLYVQVAAIDGMSSAPLPVSLPFILRDDSNPNRSSDFVRVWGGLNDKGLYFLRLPIDFRGGTLEVEAPLGAEAVAIDELRRIEVAPTVIAASGDSSAAGSTILLSGTALSGAVFRIDGTVVVPQATPSLEEPGLDVLALVVPEDVTEGVLQITKDDVTATLDQLVPWWPEQAMPVANVGQPTYESLPSANYLQRIEYDIACVPDDLFDCVSAEDLPYSIPGRELSPDGLSRSLGQRTVGLKPSGEVLVQAEFSERSPVMMFGDWSGRSLHLLPIVPNVVVRTYSASLDGGPHDSEGWIEIETDSRFNAEGLEIQWGRHRWSASTSEQYFISIPGDPPLESLLRFGSSEDSLIARSFYGSEGNPRLDPSIWLGRDNLAQIPSGPIEVSNGWGTQTVYFRVSEGEIDQALSGLTATSGTPANPDLPSVNVGQQLVVPQGIVDSQDGVFFSKFSDPQSDTPAERANWSAAAKQVVSHSEFEDDQYHVPYDAVTGMTRWGLFGSERVVQVIPTIEVSIPSSNANRNSFTVFMNGVDEGARLQFGDFSVALTADEIRNRKFVFSHMDSRLAGITPEDFSGGISIVDSGGRSEVVQVPSVTVLLVNGVAPVVTGGPIRVRPGDEILLLGSNLNAGSLAQVSHLGKVSADLSTIETVTVADDGRSATLRVSESSVPLSVWNLHFLNGRNGLYQDATWSLPEHRLLILPLD
ncbi:hypothetical protein CGZ80_10500 [Rhodopirellula sp. MGV]|nr:hypothetical protein CGZ80_10500 [Rhodopirellula sp. MGV]PNY36368.1 hypothetical protein C2E31_13110 [Rhodopirellula baltica]